MDHIYKTRVYYSDTDASNRAYHARYLDWAEHARTEMLRSILPDLKQSSLKDLGYGFVVKSASVEYHKGAELDDELTVSTSIEELGKVSAILLQKIKKGDETLASVKIKVGFINFGTGRPSKLPDQVSQALMVFCSQ